MTKIDLDEMERKARAATTQDEWHWRPADLGVLEGKHDGQVVLFCNLDAGDTDEPALIVSAGDKTHIAANSPPVTLALIACIRELKAALDDAAGMAGEWGYGASERAWREVLEKGAVIA